MSGLTPGRQSPFRRQPSTNSPAPLRATTPSTSPIKSSLLSPARGVSVPLDKGSSLGGRATQDITIVGPASYDARGDIQRDRASPTKDVTRTVDTPTRHLQSTIASPAISTTSDVFGSPLTQVRPSPAATTQQRMRQPVFETTAKPVALPRGNASYNNIPAPLLRSFRESFEVLDPNATGSLNAGSLPPVLEGLGLTDDASLSSFFPHASQNMNLAAYLDSLSTPYSQLSAPEELAAAFSAFDVDDSGQIDVNDLRQALLRTMPEPGEVNPGARLSEAEIDSVLNRFTGRRAFGSRGNTAKGDVFKWRDFVGSFSGGAEERQESVAV